LKVTNEIRISSCAADQGLKSHIYVGISHRLSDRTRRIGILIWFRCMMWMRQGPLPFKRRASMPISPAERRASSNSCQSTPERFHEFEPGENEIREGHRPAKSTDSYGGRCVIVRFIRRWISTHQGDRPVGSTAVSAGPPRPSPAALRTGSAIPQARPTFGTCTDCDR